MTLLTALACVRSEADPLAPPLLSRDVDTLADTGRPFVESGGGETARETAETGGPESPPPIVLVVYVDDQGANTLWAMPTVNERLGAESVRFTRAYTNVPLCCPARATILSGGWYPRDTGVLTNDSPNGGAVRFATSDTLATRMQAGGFATALIGKYLNNYEEGVAPEVPPGWDLFLAALYDGTGYDNTLVRGASTPDAATQGEYEDTGGEYLTTFLFDEALAFVDAHPDEPTFVFLSVTAPHIFATPSNEDLGTWAGYSPRANSFDEEDVSDKPGFLRATPRLDDEEIADVDADAQQMMENLAAVDRGVGTLLDGLTERGVLDRTVLVYTSDNGYLFGEHRLTQKGLPYEEAIKVPLLVRSPGVAPREDDRLVSINTDLAATVLDLAGLPQTGVGTSLVDAVAAPGEPLRDYLFIENYGGSHPLWAGVVTDRWKYVEWSSGDLELYDLDADPDELASTHAEPPADADLDAFASWIDAERAFAITTTNLPIGRVGQPYEAHLATWGGAPPATFVIENGELPPGLTLESDGHVSGTPTSSGVFDVTIRATDSSASCWTGAAQTWQSSFSVGVGASAVADTAERDGDKAKFTVHARPGALVTVRVSADDTFDGYTHTSSPVRAGPDGVALVTLGDLDAAHDWYWAVVADGVHRPSGGRLRR